MMDSPDMEFVWKALVAAHLAPATGPSAMLIYRMTTSMSSPHSGEELCHSAALFVRTTHHAR